MKNKKIHPVQKITIDLKNHNDICVFLNNGKIRIHKITESRIKLIGSIVDGVKFHGDKKPIKDITGGFGMSVIRNHY